MLKKWILLLLPIWFTFAVLANQAEFYNQSNNHDLTYINSNDYLPNLTASETFQQALKKQSHQTDWIFVVKDFSQKIHLWNYQFSDIFFFHHFIHAKTKLNQFHLRV